MKLKNKVALITGASRGMGNAAAILFAKEGAKIVVNYSSSEKEAKKTVDEITKNGSDAIAIKADVSKEAEVEKMVSAAIDKFGQIDVLLNNAGIVFDVPFFEKTVDEWRKVLDVNLIGTFLCSKYVSKHMLENGSGNIINISSTNGTDSFSPETMDYDASKAGVIILTRGLAKELAPKIRVNSIAPGWVDTDMNKDLPDDFVKEETENIYLNRLAKPEEIANVALFLASDASSFMTGSTVKVDGGHG
ncbi:SDR family NAD(P)-dependent oxidoreductase [Patescibacteria group bacterium]